MESGITRTTGFEEEAVTRRGARIIMRLYVYKLSSGVQCLVNRLIPVDIEFVEAEKRKDYTIKCKCLTEIESGSFEARIVGKEEKMKGE